MTAEPLRIAPSRHGGHWTIKDWGNLNFSSETGWQTAIDMFEDRIRSRFLNIIDQAQPSTVSGFAVMALDCLLIETLQQFFEGKEETPRNQSGEYFRRFLTQTSFQEFFDEDMAKMFFTQIRCGILHQAEIKGSSRIWIRDGMPLVKYAADCGGLEIHRKKFHGQLVYEFDHYIDLLRQNNSADVDLRKKFKQKMDAICKVKQV